jgi:Flp pilus assembly protein TadD/LPS sulfotransferase NodH
MTASMPPVEVAQQLDAAGALYDAGRLEEAAGAYQAIEARDPGETRATYSLAVIDMRHGRLTSALERLRRVVQREPGLFVAQHNLGFVCQSLGLWPQAAAAYTRALALRPNADETAFQLITALTILGRTEEAVEGYRLLMTSPTAVTRATISLAVLKPSAIDDDQLDVLRQVAADKVGSAEARAGLNFALGQVLEARGADDEAFAAFAAGNQLKYQALVAAAGGPAGPDAHPLAVAHDHAESVTHLKTVMTADFIAAHQGEGNDEVRPIFIVGMPRSGSTLIEQILSSHRAAQGMGESPAMAETLELSRAYDRKSPKAAPWLRDRADAYLAAMRARGWKREARLVDKTLESYLHVGMIALMFPRAVILHSVRDPVDTCLACYRQLFAEGNETLYDLGQIGAEYVSYRAVMDHWSALLPGRVIDVRHEALVADPQAQIRWLVTEACGLDWDPACLRFYETKRPVRTASVAQVRRPIFTSSIERWRRYEKHLGPLFEALGPYAPTRV